MLRNLGSKPVVAVICSHSRIDPYAYRWTKVQLCRRFAVSIVARLRGGQITKAGSHGVLWRTSGRPDQVADTEGRNADVRHEESDAASHEQSVPGAAAGLRPSDRRSARDRESGRREDDLGAGGVSPAMGDVRSTPAQT